MKKSIIDALHKVEDVKHNELCRPHVIIGIDAHEDGQPHSGVLLTQGSPGIQLGLIEALIHDLNKLKKDIMKEMTLYKIKNKEGETLEDKKKAKLSTPAEMQEKIEKTKNEVERLIKMLPPEVADKIKAFQKRMNDAIDRGDTDELEKMRDSMMNVKDFDHLIQKEEDPAKEDDGYNESDFKD